MNQAVMKEDGDVIDLVTTSPQKAQETADFLGKIEDAKADRPKYDGIAILGSHPATLSKAPFNDPRWLIYACSPDNTPYGNGANARDIPRYDQWFELHAPLADATRPYPYLRSVENKPYVWMRDRQAIDLFPGAHPYPENEMVQIFGPFFFTSSIAYMLAKAIIDCENSGIGQIGIWGVMQASDAEKAYQKPGLQYFIWQAAIRGIKVFAPEESCLFSLPEAKW